MRAGLIAIPLGFLGVIVGIGFWLFMASLLLDSDANEGALEARQFLAPPTEEQVVVGSRTSCDEIFGTPFRSVSERQWFIENCTMTPPSYALPAATGPAPASAPAVQPGQPPAPGSAPHRTDCNQIRGTPYQNNQERAWYLANCNTTAARDPGPGPDRTDCNQIRGTTYRSDNERRWFQANCR